jgi:hypothetical protein
MEASLDPQDVDTLWTPLDVGSPAESKRKCAYSFRSPIRQQKVHDIQTTTKGSTRGGTADTNESHRHVRGHTHSVLNIQTLGKEMSQPRRETKRASTYSFDAALASGLRVLATIQGFHGKCRRLGGIVPRTRSNLKTRQIGR